MSSTPEDDVRCGFCGKSKDDVSFLIAGPPPAFVCNECVVVCVEILVAKAHDAADDDDDDDRHDRQSLVRELFTACLPPEFQKNAPHLTEAILHFCAETLRILHATDPDDWRELERLKKLPLPDPDDILRGRWN